MKKLKDIYQTLENEIKFDRFNKYQFEKEFQTLGSKYKQKKLKQICNWEMLFWSFYVEDGEFKPQHSWTTKKAEVYNYPELKDFNNEALNYIKVRAENSDNPIIKSRYYHFLWHSPDKHLEYSIKAIESYIDVLKLKRISDGIELQEVCKSLISLAISSKQQLDKVITEVKDLIELRNIELYRANEISTFILEKI